MSFERIKEVKNGEKFGTDGFWIQIPEEGVEFFAKLWEPSSGAVKANVTFIHGIGEHILRYNEMFEKFTKAGIRVFAWDQRGFGRTVHKNSLQVEGGRANAMVLGDSQGWDVALADIFRAYKFSYQEVPTVSADSQFGHSMGGLLATAFAITYKAQIKITGLICSAPAFKPGFPIPTIKRVVARFVSKFLGSMNIPTEIDSTGISKDPAVVEAYKNDSYVHGMGSLRTLVSLVENGEFYWAEGYKDYDENVAFLETFGTIDRLTSFDAGKEFYEKLQAKDKKFRQWDGLWHEQQEMEIEALSSIYPDTFTRITDKSFSLIVTVDSEEHDKLPEDDLPYLELIVEYSEKYPEEAPLITLENVQNIAEEQMADINAQISVLIEESLGMAMIFTICSTLKDSLDLMASQESERRLSEAEEARKKIEEAENKKFVGTPVTHESFMEWKNKFDLLDLHGLNAADILKGKLSGRQLFEEDHSLAISDNAYADEGDDIVVDLGLFEREFDNLDIEDALLIPDSDDD